MSKGWKPVAGNRVIDARSGCERGVAASVQAEGHQSRGEGDQGRDEYFELRRGGRCCCMMMDCLTRHATPSSLEQREDAIQSSQGIQQSSEGGE